MKKIELTRGKFAIIDNEDFPYLKRFKWYLSGDGKFAKRDIFNGRLNTAIYMQSLLVQGKRGFMIMHRNNDGLDNRKENLILVHLRYVIHHRPISNFKFGKSSKYKGVCWDKQCGKWRAEIVFNSKRFHLGRYFKTEKEAALVYNEKAKELYGEFAYQNKI